MHGGFDLDDKLPSEPNENLIVNTEDTIIPVTIKQLIDSNFSIDQPFLVDGIPRKQFSIVGVVRSVQEEEIWTLYDIDESTGVFKVQDFSKDFSSLEQTFNVGTYVFVVGKINFFESTPVISAFSVKPVIDFDQIPYHFIYTLFVHFSTLRGLPPNTVFSFSKTIGQSAETAINNNNNNNNNNNINNVNKETNQNQDELIRKKILDFIRSKHASVNKSEIVKFLGNSYPLEKITNSLNVLEYNGEIYTTGIDTYVLSWESFLFKNNVF